MNGRIALLVAVLLGLSGCAGHQAHREGMRALQEGRIDEGLAGLRAAVDADPGNVGYRQSLVQTENRLATRFAAAAQTSLAQGDIDAAALLLEKAKEVSPTDDLVIRTQGLLDARRREMAALGPVETLIRNGEVAQARSRIDELRTRFPESRSLAELDRRLRDEHVASPIVPPQLAEKLRQPVTLEFRDASLRQIFDLLAERFGINFVFDRDLSLDQKTSILLHDSTVDDALRYIARTNQLERKVLSGNTLLVYPASEQKKRDYEDLVTRSFYVTNADIKATATMVKDIGKVREMFVDEQSNLLVIRDTPEVVDVVRRLIETQDRPKPEVMLDLEVLEVGETNLSEIGIRWPDQISYSIRGGSGEAGTLPLPVFRNPDSSLVQVTITNPALIATLRASGGNSSILANPRIRVRNKEKAKILVGDKVPVVTTTTTATGVVSESVSYLEVGIRVEAEPEVYFNQDVGIKLSLEVSNIVREIQTPGGSVAYQLGTRNAETMLQLRDGETQVLAGLINDTDRLSSTKVPLLGDVPLLGRLFSSRGVNQSRSEVILLVTPRILRGYDASGAGNAGFYSGTSARVDTRPLLPGASAAETSPMTSGAAPATGRPSASNPVSLGNAGIAGTIGQPASIRLLTGDAPRAGDTFIVSVAPSRAIEGRAVEIELHFDPSHLQAAGEQPSHGDCTTAADNLRGRITLSCPDSGALSGPTRPGVRFEVDRKALGAVLVSVSSAKLKGPSGSVAVLPVDGPLIIPVAR
ncbi:MAG: general secretion pathway protein GspD [Burkholderiaceae bacterium]|nr:general secretion pathway protein GspD [Burkholderiaceae bacterium]